MSNGQFFIPGFGTHLMRYKDIYTRQPIHGRMGVGGEFRCILRNSMGGVVQDTGWFPNLITNLGLIQMGQYQAACSPVGWTNNFHIGSSGTAAAFTDTSLNGWLASSGQGAPNSSSSGTPTAPDYEFWEIRGKRFAAGTGTGTVREVGIGCSGTNINICVHSVLPSPIVKAADQVLDVYYKFTVWPDLTDTTGVVNIAGDDYDYTVRAMEVTDGSSHLTQTQITLYGNSSVHIAYAGNIGTITGLPSTATPSPWNTRNPVSYITAAGSGFLTQELFWDLGNANHASGVRSLALRHCFNTTGINKGFQVQFNRQSDNAAIEKDNTKVLYVQFKTLWARH